MHAHTPRPDAGRSASAAAASPALPAARRAIDERFTIHCMLYVLAALGEQGAGTCMVGYVEWVVTD